MKGIIFTLNAKDCDNNKTKLVMQQIRDAIDNFIEEHPPTPIPLPLRWFIVELSLQEIQSKIGRGVLMTQECFEVAKQIKGFDPSMFESMLKYFNEVYIAHYILSRYSA